MALLRKKIKASTLPETLIAMVIVSIAFTIAIAVYIQVASVGDYYQQQYIDQLLNKIAMEARNGNFLQTQEIDGLVIRTEITPYQNNEQLSLLHIIALDPQDHKVAEFKEVNYLPKWKAEE